MTLALLLLLLLSIALRAYQIDSPGLLMDREFNSAIIARDFYLARSDAVENWRKELAHATRNNMPGLEPPLTEWLVSHLYTLAGGESFRVARVLTSTVWLLGGCFMFLLARELVSRDAALFAVGFYWLMPLGVLLSRSFQPDSIMMLGFLAGLYAIVKYHQNPSRSGLLTAATISGATILYRPIVLFALCAAFILLQGHRYGVWRALFRPSTLIFGFIVLLPTFAFYGYQTFVTERFANQVTMTFQPHLWLELKYWGGWALLAVDAVGVAGALAAAVGFALLPSGLPRLVVVGMALGYAVLGFSFTMHIHTHDYYHAQLIPLVAITASPTAVLMARTLCNASERSLQWIIGIVMVAVCGVALVRDVYVSRDPVDLMDEQTAHEIGERVQHSLRVVTVSSYYGVPLQYQAEFTGSFWPRPQSERGDFQLGLAERWKSLGFEPEYFVITAFADYVRHHQDLAAYLEANCILEVSSPNYLIYSACRPPVQGFQ